MTRFGVKILQISLQCMELSSCLSTSDRRLRSWKMVTVFIRLTALGAY